MTKARTANPTEARTAWETAESRSSSDVLAILAPTSEEPQALQRTGIWKNGTLTAQATASAA